MHPSITLTGGGPGAVAALKRHFRAATRALGTKAPLVAYVGSASSDDKGFFAMIAAALAVNGTRVELARTASRRASVAVAKKLLEESDLIFVSGGDVEHGMKVLKEHGLDDVLRHLASGGKPMFGVSAGSIMLGREWVRFPGDDDARAEIFPCLGIAPIHVDAHAEDDDWSELRTLVRLLHARGDRAPIGHGLTTRGGVTVSAGPQGVKVRAIGTAIPRVGFARGKVVDRAPLPVSALAKKK